MKRANKKSSAKCASPNQEDSSHCPTSASPNKAAEVDRVTQRSFTKTILGHLLWLYIIGVYAITCFLAAPAFFWAIFRGWYIGAFLLAGVNDLGKRDSVVEWMHNSSFILLRWYRGGLGTIANVFARGSRIIVENPLKLCMAGREGETSGLPPTILCYHPHGVLPLGLAYAITARAFPSEFQYRLIAASFLSSFCTYLRIIISPLVIFDGSSKTDFTRNLQKRRNLVLIPGGFEEATITRAGSARLYLKNRKGMVKYALQHGYSLTPAYGFGENETLCNVNGWEKYRLKLNQFGIPGVLSAGRIGIYPRNVPLMLVVGEPLQLPQRTHPSSEDIEYWHQEYCKKLEELYTRNIQHYRQYLETLTTEGKDIPSLWELAAKADAITYFDIKNTT